MKLDWTSTTEVVQQAQASAVEQAKGRRVAWKSLLLLKVPVEKLERLPYTTTEGSVPKEK